MPALLAGGLRLCLWLIPYGAGKRRTMGSLAFGQGSGAGAGPG